MISPATLKKCSGEIKIQIHYQLGLGQFHARVISNVGSLSILNKG